MKILYPKNYKQNQMIKLQVLLLSYLLLSSTIAQQTYFGNYGTSGKTCCPKRIALTNEKINWEKNYICNGDFESPKLPSDKNCLQYADIHCWSSSGKFQISKPVYYTDMKDQLLELDPDDNGHYFKQNINLYEGKFELRFDYSPKKAYNPEESTFYVYFNGVEVLKVLPDQHGVTTIVVTVNGREGPNTLKFVDTGKIKHHGAGIDNVGIYEWKTNEFCEVEEIQAVGAGYPIVASSVLSQVYNNYQLDSGRNSLAYAWCPYKHGQLGNWIQVSATKPELWNSVTIQGRGDSNQWVTGFKLSYTLDGKNWMEYENGKKFSGSTDRVTKVKHTLTPFYARTVRLTVLSFYGTTCMRFGMTFLKTA